MAYDDMEKSNEYYFKSISLADQNSDVTEIITPTLNLGWNYLDIEKPDKAINHLEKARNYIRADWRGLIPICIYIIYMGFIILRVNNMDRQ